MTVNPQIPKYLQLALSRSVNAFSKVKKKRSLLAELLLVLIIIIFVSLNLLSGIYIANYLEKIYLFLFRTVSDEDLNKWYEKKDKYELLQKSGGAA